MKKKQTRLCFPRGSVSIILLKLKLLTFLLLTAATVSAATNSYAQQTKLNFKFQQVSVKEVFDEIESSSEFIFLYNENSVDLSRKVSVQAEDESIEKILDRVFEGTENVYKIYDRQIVILENENSRLPENLEDSKGIIQPQNTKIIGKVTNEHGEPLPGVTVIIMGTAQGTVTNIDGDYNISNVPLNAILQFSFVGLKTQEISVTGRTTINVILAADAIGIEEVVAVGYATMKKTDLTGSVGSVGNEELTVRGTTSPLEALQGQVAGVNITASTGRAGTDFDIKIRGDNSLSGGNPLYVVDGMVTGNIQFLNPQDIERIDILKDASSTAIYGSRGSNGVVIVTTKQASNMRNQQPLISYSGYYGVRSPARKPDLMNGDEYWEYRQNAYLGAEFQSGNDITQPEFDQAWVDARTSYDNSEVLRDILANKNYTNWSDLMVDNGAQQNHWLSISGKSDSKMTYLFGVGYQSEEGIFANEWLKRYNFKANINHEISEKWSAGTNINLALSEAEIGDWRGANVYDAFTLPPTVATYIPEGYDNAGGLTLVPAASYGMAINGQLNPLITRENLRDNERTLNALGNVYLQYYPIKDLFIKTTFSPYVEITKHGTYEGSETWQRALEDPAADLAQSDYITYTWDNQLNYKKTIDNHQFNFDALYSMSSNTTETMYIAVENLPFESLWHNLGSAPDVVEVNSSFSKATLVSVLGRLNYSYKGKYMLTAAYRSDGSSKLATGNKWASFPSFALAWRASEEEFLQNFESLSNLKFRVSYGYTGNNNISAYSTQRYATSQRYYEFNGTVANGFVPSNMANASLTWEKTREFNFGLDFGFLANRINGSVDVYDKLSSELLMDRTLAFETGWSSVTANIGSVSNKGVELLLHSMNVSTKDLKWETTFTFSKNINAIEELYGGTEDDLGNLWFIGRPVNVNYSYVFDGIWQADERDEAAIYGQTEGQAKVKDLDSNGLIDGEDRDIIGTPDPSWSGSFSTTLRFKGFDLNASVYTQQGVHVYSPFHRDYTAYDERWRNKLALNYYMAENNVTEARVSNEYPMPKNSGIFWGNENCGYFKDVSYVKVQNISLGYTFNTGQLEKIKLKMLRIYINILNPFVFSKFDGFDPEWAESRFGGGMSTITYQFGVNVKF